jgi:acetylornithine aminotransferase/acetylornithine/N-succinyldiaminopimelate aminotransferase
MRMARLATGREEIISFSGSFHGRTADAISSSFLGKYRELGKPNVPGHQMAEFGDIGSVHALASERTAAVIVEPIQSMAGVREASPEFFTGLRELCDRLGIILIFDEIQTGMGRTGTWFFAGGDPAGGTVPDVVTLAKSLGSGIPVGACLVSEKVAGRIRENDLGTTFGGGMLAMAGVLATLEAIEMDAMIENASVVEQHVRKRLPKVRGVVSVRGKGCLLGIELSDNAAEVHSRLLDRKIITGTSSDPRVLRLLPPLCVSTTEIDIFTDALAECTEHADSEAA